MFSDPVVVPVGAGTASLSRIVLNGQSSIYRTASEDRTLRISHQLTSKRRVRRMVRLDAEVSGTDPLDINTNKLMPFSVYLVIDCPSQKDITDVTDNVFTLVNDLAKFLTDNSGANLSKVIGAEV